MPDSELTAAFFAAREAMEARTAEIDRLMRENQPLCTGGTWHPLLEDIEMGIGDGTHRNA